MKPILVVFCNLFLLAQANQLKAQSWRKFEPLNTTRADVETVLGSGGEGYEVAYQLTDGKLSIEYSSGPCTSERKGGWNVPKDVVISLHFSPEHPKTVSELKLDSRKYRKVIGKHLPSVTYYINNEDGIVYAIQMGKVDWVEYGPAKKDEDLRCKN
jgi:hypothetical protein